MTSKLLRKWAIAAPFALLCFGPWGTPVQAESCGLITEYKSYETIRQKFGFDTFITTTPAKKYLTETITDDVASYTSYDLPGDNTIINWIAIPYVWTGLSHPRAGQNTITSTGYTDRNPHCTVCTNCTPGQFGDTFEWYED